MKLQIEYNSFQWYLKFWKSPHIFDKSDSNLYMIFLNRFLGI